MVEEQFSALADPHRRELLVYCYRMLGSIHDAEDLVQDTMLRAWRSRDTFDADRGSMRTWLYRIATNACLTALANTSRRPLPSGLVGASDSIAWPLPAKRTDIPWLEPVPSELLDGTPADPAAVIASRDSVRLAFVAALQHLPARQRAVLILRDVLAMPAAEVAAQLDSTVASVNSALQRARAQLADVAPVESSVEPPGSAADRSLIDRYMTAFVGGDVTAFVSLLRKDVELEMPPRDMWFAGRDLVSAFLVSVFGSRWRMRAVDVNGGPGIAAYVSTGDGVRAANQIQALTIEDGLVARIVSFVDPSLFAIFGLPPTWPE